MNPLVHPGAPTRPRILSVPVIAHSVVCDLKPEATLASQLHEVLMTLGADSGYAELHGGHVSPLSFCVPDVAADGKALSFSETRTHPKANFLFGSATLGVRDDLPYMHSHCSWQAEAGPLEGGHVWLDTQVGALPLAATVTAIYGAQWQSATDPESQMPVFTPIERTSSVPEFITRTENVIVSRVLPNIDITEAVLNICREASVSRACVRAGLGSFVGATFQKTGSGERTIIDGPATEVIALAGDVRSENGDYSTRLSCVLVDRHGVVHAGELVPGENLVAATFELTIQCLDESQPPAPRQPVTH